MESDWAGLPKHLLDMILDKLLSVSDYIGFGAVCEQWHSVTMENKIQFLQNKCCRQVPFLMIPTEEDNIDEKRSLYSVTRDKLYDFSLRVPYKKRLSGSSHGWLFTVKETLGLTLINPFSGATIELPPIMDPSIFGPPEIEYQGEDDFDFEVVYDPTPIEVEFEVMKATLSADPALSPNDYIVTAIYSGCCRLAFIRAGDEAWTYIDRERFKLIHDVIFYKGKFYAVDYWCGVLMIDLNTRAAGEMREAAPQVEVIVPRTNVSFERRTYIVESSTGDLLIVERFLKTGDDLQHETSAFKVYKLVLQQTEEGSTELVEVKSLGGDSLFLGDNHSICVSASKWTGCQPNSIYYTDDYIDILLHPPSGRRDVGVFNLENGSIGRHYLLHPKHNHMPPSIWILPTLS